MKILAKWLRPVVALLAASDLCSAAQSASRWPSPERSYSLEFASEESGRQAVFDDEGFAWEIQLDFLMVEHPRVSVNARLPEAGRFDVVQANPQARVQLERKGTNTVEVEAELRPLSAEDVAGRARDKMMQLAEPLLKKIRPEAEKLNKDDIIEFLRQRGAEIPILADREKDKEKQKAKELKTLRAAYTDLRTVEDLAPELRRLLPEIAAAHPAWVTAKDQARWAVARPQELRDDYFILTSYEIMDEYLKQCGMGIDSNIPGYRARLDTRMDAVYVILAGKVGEDPLRSAAISQAMTGDESDRLRETLSVRLRCRFFPETDPQDPNSQWYSAQRVGSRVKGARSVRLQGTLNPAEHDAADWWLLDGYNPAMVMLQAGKNPDVRWDGPFPCEGGARIKVVATGKNKVDYRLDLQPVGAELGDSEVLIHESPCWAGAKFPF